MLIAVNFHYVRASFDAPHPAIYGRTPAQLARQLDALGQIGTFVSAEDVREAVQDGAALPQRALLVTFDDGLREQYEHALPVLREKGVPAVFFVNTAPIAEERVLMVHKIHLLRARVAPARLMQRLRRAAKEEGRQLDAEEEEEAAKATAHYFYDEPEVARLKYLLNFTLERPVRDRLIDQCFEAVFPGREASISRELYLSVEQVRALHRRSDAAVGSHTHEHLPLGLLAGEELRRQVRGAYHHLEDWTGAPPYAVSYPYGAREACTPEVADACSEAGLAFGFTMERAGNPSVRERPLLLGRFDCNDLPGGKRPQFEAETLFEQVPAATWYRSSGKSASS